MIVRILSCGVHWWAKYSKDLSDPFCFRRKSAFFNTTGLKFGRTLRYLYLHRGVIRFNGTSGFDPEHVEAISGRTFHTPGSAEYKGATTLLFDLPAKGKTPDVYLVTLNHLDHGAIEFRQKSWRSPGIEVIAVSRYRERFEAMLLMAPGEWVQSARGLWQVSSNSHQLTLTEA